MKKRRKKRKRSRIKRWASKLWLFVYRWLFEPERERKQRLVCEKTCDAIEKTKEATERDSTRDFLIGPISTHSLAQHYKNKGIERAGSLVEIFNDEMQFLLKEHIAENFESVSSDKILGGGSRASAMILGTVTMGAKDGKNTSVPKELALPTQIESEDETKVRGVAQVQQQTGYKSHVYLVRSWSDYKSMIQCKVPTLLEERGHWKIAMFLGVEKFKNKEWVDWADREEDSKDDWTDAKWAKWLIGDQIYVGWVHPGAMRKVGTGAMGQWW